MRNITWLVRAAAKDSSSTLKAAGVSLVRAIAAVENGDWAAAAQGGVIAARERSAVAMKKKQAKLAEPTSRAEDLETRTVRRWLELFPRRELVGPSQVFSFEPRAQPFARVECHRRRTVLGKKHSRRTHEPSGRTSFTFMVPPKRIDNSGQAGA